MWLRQFKALSDATRLRLLHLLQFSPFSVNELVQIFRMVQSRISRHLKILLEAGLLESRRDGQWIFYSVPRDGMYRDFLDAQFPFISEDPACEQDLRTARAMLETRKEASRQFFDAIAGRWDELHSEILGTFDLPEAVCGCLPSGCRSVADLGCGTGAVLVAMAEACGTCIGVDSSQSMLAVCADRIARCTFPEDRFSLRIGELPHLPLRDHETDFASINFVLHHLQDIEPSLREVHRCLAADGRLVVTEFLAHTDESMRIRHGDVRLGFPAEELVSALQRTGFAVSDTSEVKVQRNMTVLLIQASVLPA